MKTNIPQTPTISPRDLSNRLMDLRCQATLFRDLRSLFSSCVQRGGMPGIEDINWESWYGLSLIAGAMASELEALDVTVCPPHMGGLQ